MPTVSSNSCPETLLGQFKEDASILDIHKAIRESLPYETDGAYQCAIIITIDDDTAGRGEVPQSVQIFALPRLTELTLQESINKLLAIPNPEGIFVLEQKFFPSFNCLIDPRIRSYGRKQYYCRGDFISAGFDIPIFFKDLPSNIFDAESLRNYLVTAVGDAMFAYYNAINDEAKRADAQEKVFGSTKFSEQMLEFAKRFLAETENAEKGLICNVE